MQSEEDAGRLIRLGAPTERVIVTGNLKYDLALPDETNLSAWLQSELARSGRAPLLVAGSVLANEEASVLRAFARVEHEFPRAFLVLAPRKPAQFENAAAIVARSGHIFLRRSDITLNGSGVAGFSEPVSVFLLDSLGGRGEIYQQADAVFVGGSLVAAGGHNILEPAAFGKVPVYGASMENFREMSAKFMGAGAAVQVSDGDELGAAWASLLREPERAARMGAIARKLVEHNRGATQRVLEHIENEIGAGKART